MGVAINDDDLMIVLNAFSEATGVARANGLSGYHAVTAVKAATAKVASHILGRDFSAEEIDRVLMEIR